MTSPDPSALNWTCRVQFEVRVANEELPPAVSDERFNTQGRAGTYDALTARLPCAEHAPLYFLPAGLFSAHTLSVYESLPQPSCSCTACAATTPTSAGATGWRDAATGTFAYTRLSFFEFL